MLCWAGWLLIVERLIVPPRRCGIDAKTSRIASFDDCGRTEFDGTLPKPSKPSVLVLKSSSACLIPVSRTSWVLALCQHHGTLPCFLLFASVHNVRVKVFGQGKETLFGS